MAPLTQLLATLCFFALELRDAALDRRAGPRVDGRDAAIRALANGACLVARMLNDVARLQLGAFDRSLRFAFGAQDLVDLAAVFWLGAPGLDGHTGNGATGVPPIGSAPGIVTRTICAALGARRSRCGLTQL